MDKVREATRIAKEKNAQNLIIDGPICNTMRRLCQTLLALRHLIVLSLAKPPFFVFPDLNTGSTTYKAVQRSADLISIGPMLQVCKPVNDLSRGALVDDIVYTIA